MKQIVTIRKKPMKDGVTSLFLDYQLDGIRHKEYLRLYLYPEDGPDGKIKKYQNKETMKLAQTAQAKRTIQIQAGTLEVQTKRAPITLNDFLVERVGRYEAEGQDAYARSLDLTRRYLLHFVGDKFLIKSMTREKLLEFLAWLSSPDLAKYAPDLAHAGKTLSESTVHIHYVNLSTQLNAAVRAGHVDRNVCQTLESVEKPHKVESMRQHLTLQEIKKLSDTPCKSDHLKYAFLFCCFCGLRLSDVMKLEWSQIIDDGKGGLMVETRMKKTDTPIYLPLSPNAVAWLPKKRPISNRVFYALVNKATIENRLRAWAKKAGIKKYLTFHCSRHTFATLLLTYGADIYTVSKLLGHASVTTTQIYAKIVDAKKTEAVNSIPTL